MASKFLFFRLILTVAALHFSTFSAAAVKDGGAAPAIHIISTVKSSFSINIKAAGTLKGSAQLSPSQDYQIKVDVKDVFYASAVYGLQFASFHAYEPARDTGRAAIYWKADDYGFSISYDKLNYKPMAPWESE